MRIVVETRTGPRAGHRVWLSTRQQLRFGRTEWAEFCVPDDRTMADIQFALECGGRGCRVRNLAGDRPLFVNGLRVEHHTLVSGDLIRAGETEFLVSIQSTRDDNPSTLPLEATNKLISRPPVKYTAVGDGEMVCLSGQRSETSEVDIATLLHSEHSMYLLLHRDLAEESDWQAITGLPASTSSGSSTGIVLDNAQGSALIDPDDLSLEGRGVAFVGPSSSLDRFELIQRNWPRNALAVLFTGREESLMRGIVNERPLLSVHPSDLAGRLLRTRTLFAESELEGLAGLLLPMSDTHWGIFASPRFRPVWERLGIAETPTNHHKSDWNRFESFWAAADEAEQPGKDLKSGQTLAAG